MPNTESGQRDYLLASLLRCNECSRHESLGVSGDNYPKDLSPAGSLSAFRGPAAAPRTAAFARISR